MISRAEVKATILITRVTAAFVFTLLTLLTPTFSGGEHHAMLLLESLHYSFTLQA
jgi:hypothetical protein